MPMRWASLGTGKPDGRGAVGVDPAELGRVFDAERAGRGYRVRYGVADVTAFVRPGGQLDGESLRRGQTVYAPDGCAHLYPEQLTDDAASLFPGQVRPAFVWDVQLDPDGEGTSAEVHRAIAVERACVEVVTAAALRHRVGESFSGMIVDVTDGVGLVQLRDPLILAPAVGECTAGEEVTVRLLEAEIARRRVRFEVVGD